MSTGNVCCFATPVGEAGDDMLVLVDVYAREGGWNLLCKFFDNLGPIPHHMHQNEEFARKGGSEGKARGLLLPAAVQLHRQQLPLHLHGPRARHDQGRRSEVPGALERGRHGILYHAKAYKLQPGTGWQIDAGILHAPGSLVTYEPQVNSDVFGMFQSMVEGRAVPWDLLVKDVPPEHHHDLDYIIAMLDWDANVDPEFGKHRLFHPKPVRDEVEMAVRRVQREVGGLLHG